MKVSRNGRNVLLVDADGLCESRSGEEFRTTSRWHDWLAVGSIHREIGNAL